jgi:hypothetical protein
VFEVVGCSLLISFRNFLARSSVKINDKFGQRLLWGEEQTSYDFRTSKWSFSGEHGEQNLHRVHEIEKKGAGNMATYRDPVRCFAPLEVIERLLEIRVEAGYSPAVYLLSPDDLADYLDACGFDVYALSEAEAEFHFGDYRAPLAPGGDHAHSSLTQH